MLTRHYESRGIHPWGNIEVYLDLITNRYSYELYAVTDVGEVPVYESAGIFESTQEVYDDAYRQAELHKLWEYQTVMRKE